MYTLTLFIASKWTVELADVTKKLFTIKVDGVPVGEQDGKIYAFFDESDHKETTLWEIEPAKKVRPVDAASSDSEDKSTYVVRPMSEA